MQLLSPATTGAGFAIVVALVVAVFVIGSVLIARRSARQATQRPPLHRLQLLEGWTLTGVVGSARGSIRLAFSKGDPIWITASPSGIIAADATEPPREALRDIRDDDPWRGLVGTMFLEPVLEESGTVLLRFMGGQVRLVASGDTLATTR